MTNNMKNYNFQDLNILEMFIEVIPTISGDSEL